MTEEIFDIVDEHDRVIGQAPRSEVHARGLLHRAVHIFVFTSDGRLLIQLRSATKDEYPRCYTSSASGHLGAGESYEAAAPRELAEELGIEAPVEYLAKFPAGPHLANEHSVLYRIYSDEQPTIDPAEIERVEYYDLPSLKALIDEHPERFAPPFVYLFRWYCEQRNSARQ